MATDLKRSLAFHRIKLVLSFILWNLPLLSWGQVYELPTQGNWVGDVQSAVSEPGETLSDVGIRYDMGLYEMKKANPRLDSQHFLTPGTSIVIPSQFQLPTVPHTGIVINLATYRLFYFPPQENIVITMPVGIGRDGFDTPVGITKVLFKERDPIWHPTARLRQEAAKQGIMMPASFPPGAANPLGRHVLRLSWPTYLIHGTNRREGIGMKISAGCIRMLPEDIEYLFDYVTVGTPVQIINEPLSLGHQAKIASQVNKPLWQRFSFKKGREV